MTHADQVTLAIAAALFVTLIGCLLKIHRVREWHHGYYGIAIVIIGVLNHAPIWLLAIGVYLLADDLVQHAAEALGIVQPFSDFTPVHKLGAWLIAVNWKAQGMWLPLAICAALFALAVFSALHWGP